MRIIYEEHHEPALGRFKEALVQDSVNQMIYAYDSEGTYLLIDASGLEVNIDAADVNGLSAVATSGSYADLSGKPSLSTVATSGSYSDLTNKPTIPVLPTLATIATSGSYADLLNKPALFSGAYADLTGKPALFSGSYADLTNKPTLFSGAYADLTGKPDLSVYALTSSLAAVATAGTYASLTGKPTLFSGSYTDLTNKPTIPAAQVNSDWTAVSGVAQILNKPTLFSGAYADLTGKPTLFDGAYASLTGKPALATVATSGSYADLSNKPTIPAAQVNADWTAVSGVAQILNKPTLFSGAYADLTGKPTLFSGSYTDLTNKPTLGTLASLSPTGTADNTTYLRGDGTWATVASSGGFANPMTTAGDIIYGGASGAATRLAAGTSSQVLIGGSTPSWGQVAIGSMVSGLATGVATFLATPSSANMAAMLTDETGTGSNVFATSPTLTTPILGAATATTINKVTITAPTTNATLTLVQGSTLATAGAFSTTLTATAATNVTLPTTGTLATLAGTETFTNKTLTDPKINVMKGTDNSNVFGFNLAGASAVNYLKIGNALTGGRVNITAFGSDTNVDMSYTSQAAGIHVFNSTSAGTMFRISGATTNANYAEIQASATGSPIAMVASGSDTNIGMNLVPKGTGRLQAAGVNVPTISSTDTFTNKTISGASNTLSNIAVGSIAATGTASSSTYLRGDGTWATPASSGGTPVNDPTFNLAVGTTDTNAGQTANYVLYRTSVAQTITGIECYLTNTQASSVIQLGIYNAAGTLLSSGTFTTDSSTGIKSVTLAASQALTARTNYYLALLNQTNEANTKFLSANSMNNSALTSRVLNTTAGLPSTLPGTRDSLPTALYLMPF